MRSFLLFLSPLLVAAGVVAAQPTSGSLVGKVDGDPLRYTCSPADAAGKITCDFVQVLLSKKARPEDLSDSLAMIPEMLADKDGAVANMCAGDIAGAKASIEKLASGQSLPDGTTPPNDPEGIEFMRQSIAAVEALCRDRTSANVEALLRLTHERESKTCTAFINEYSQTFVSVADNLWVVESSPSGACGVVRTSRFSLPNGSLSMLWEYTSQKVITNQVGTSETGIACADYEEDPVLYTWNSPPQRIDCVYID